MRLTAMVRDAVTLAVKGKVASFNFSSLRRRGRTELNPGDVHAECAFVHAGEFKSNKANGLLVASKRLKVNGEKRTREATW